MARTKTGRKFHINNNSAPSTEPTTPPVVPPKVTETSPPKPTASKKNVETEQQEQEQQPIQSIICFYEILGVSKTATESELKKAYYKKAREVHPDKNNSPEAKEEFQKLGRIYSILKEPSTRKFYDKHGDVEGDNTFNGQDLYEAWMKQYDIVRVSEERIKDFFAQQEIQKKSSVNNVSEDEEKDLIEFYNKKKGNMKSIKEFVIGCENKKDIIRMCDFIKSLIDNGKLESYPIFFQTATLTPGSNKNVVEKEKEKVKDEDEDMEGEGDEIGSQDEEDDDEDDEEEDSGEVSKKVSKTNKKKQNNSVLKKISKKVSKK